MDKSELYIRMCNKAKEIQKTIRCNDDNEQDEYFYCLSCKDRLGVEVGPHYNYYWCNCNAQCVWLPRQDQLQEMVEEIKDKNHLIFRFYKFLMRSKYEKQSSQSTYVVLINIIEGCSMEIMWLCFVMKEKYNRSWNGKDWIKS